MQKVGIYSGTFDPVHEGHLAFAREAVKQAGLEKVFFMVEPRPRRKQGVKAYEHRSHMVQLATRRYPRFGSILLDQDRFTPAETLPVLAKRFQGVELHLLIGDDMLKLLPAWPGVDGLLGQVGFVVGLRGMNHTDALKQIKNIENTRGVKMRFRVLKSPKPKVSSTDIKRSIKNKLPPSGLPPVVAEYIKRQGLYAGSDSTSVNSS